MTTLSLLPAFALNVPVGGILVHEHHEEDLHAHRLLPGSQNTASQATAFSSDGHKHEDVDLSNEGEGCLFHVNSVVSRLPRASTPHLPQTKWTPPPGLGARFLLPLPSACSRDSIPGLDEAPLRAHDMLAHLLLNGHSLLI